jgi:hypothetical protein
VLLCVCFLRVGSLGDFPTRIVLLSYFEEQNEFPFLFHFFFFFCGFSKVCLKKNGREKASVTSGGDTCIYVFDFKNCFAAGIELSMRANHGLAHLEGAREIRFAWL